MSYEYGRITTPSTGLRLHLNENTAGCSPKVLAALQALTREQAAYYPDYDAVAAAVAERLGVAANEIALTNGLDEGILAASIVTLRAGSPREPDEAIVVVPAFDMYAACADAVGGRVIEVPLDRDFAFPIAALKKAITPRTRLIFLTSPNNPTGLVIPRAQIVDVALAAPQAMVFVDEAYADFTGETLLNDRDARRLPNLVIGRTFAKAYGLAGLRAGALVGQAATLAALRKVIPPYSLNVCAAIALTAGLEDEEYFRWYLSQVEQSKVKLYEALTRLGIRHWQSAANFVLADFGDRAPRVVEGLTARHVFVRDKSRDPACPGCVRMTTGVVAHTDRLIAALEEVLCGAAS
ncbi:MAG TPA: histidinol-phosphate transaminase [Vicinamibacterales bacterium]|nr:histidinol-phosphate transaminase [Vicinamibacterales bacterium]